MNSDLDKALIEVIQKICAKYGSMAVLRGGMSLRLQAIPRSTIDADFYFQSTKSKKDFGPELIEFLKTFCSDVNHSYDSKKLQIRAKYNEELIIVEASAQESFKPISISTVGVTEKYNLQPSIISIVPPDMAFANKCGAWLDRRLERDLYDIYVYYEIFNAIPNEVLLLKRITKPNYSKGLKPKPKFSTIEDFLAFIKEYSRSIKSEELEEALIDVVDEREMTGLGDRIKNVIMRLNF